MKIKNLLYEAIGRAYGESRNRDKVVDTDLVNSIVVEILKSLPPQVVDLCGSCLNSDENKLCKYWKSNDIKT